jgi:hypothetical protein
VILPGTKVSPIVMPSGGVKRGIAVGTGGCNRSVSLMIALR